MRTCFLQDVRKSIFLTYDTARIPLINLFVYMQNNYSFHFYSADSDMDFSIEQEFTDLEPGTYYLTAFSQGGDFKGDNTFELYAVTSEGEQVDPFKLTSYIDWKNPTIPEIKVTDGKLTIGVRIKSNPTSWGTVDNFALYKISD